MTDDTTLLRAYREQGSEEAFRTLVERHFPLVYGTALRGLEGRRDIAEEVSQQVFTLMAKESDKLRQHPLLPGWLHRCTCHVAARRRRDEARRLERERKAALLQDEGQEPSQELDWTQLRPQLDQMLDGLSEKDRSALILRFLENRPHAQVATLLGLSEDAARMRVERALEKLRALLARRGLRTTAETLSALLAAQGLCAAPEGLALTVANGALASITTLGATGTSTALLLSMITTNKAMVAAGLTCLLAVGAASYEHFRASAAEDSLRDANKRVTQLRSEQQDLQRRVRELSNTGTRQPDITVPTATAAKERSRSQLEFYADYLVANPEFLEQTKKRRQANLGLKYSAFYRRLGLTKEQIAAFEVLVVEQEQFDEDMIMAAHNKGIALDSSEFKQLRLEQKAELTQRQKELLGEAGVQQLNEYNKTEPSRNAVAEIASALLYTHSTLSKTQAEQLENLIALNTPPDTEKNIGQRPKQPDWNSVERNAASILDPVQMEALRTLIRKRTSEARLFEILEQNPIFPGNSTRTRVSS